MSTSYLHTLFVEHDATQEALAWVARVRELQLAQPDRPAGVMFSYCCSRGRRVQHRNGTASLTCPVHRSSISSADWAEDLLRTHGLPIAAAWMMRVDTTSKKSLLG